MRLPMRLLVLATFVLGGVGAVLHPSAARLGGRSSSAMASGPLPAAPVTPASWAQALLGWLGDPASGENLRVITAWERAEGGHWANAARYNPLDTTQPELGSWPVNPAGVQAYTSWGQGLAATVATLRNGLYGAVLAALGRADCALCVADAVAASPWGTGWFPA